MGNTGSFKVSMWDFETKDLITTTTVTVTDSSKFTYNSITPINVVANTKYMVSVNNNSGGVQKLYLIYTKKSNTTNSSIYPFTVGSVTYEAHGETQSSTPVFPDIVSWNIASFTGVADIQFEYTK